MVKIPTWPYISIPTEFKLETFNPENIIWTLIIFSKIFYKIKAYIYLSITKIKIDNEYLNNIIEKDVSLILNGGEPIFPILIDNVSNAFQSILLKNLVNKITEKNEEGESNFEEKEENKIIENELKIKGSDEENQKIFEKEIEKFKTNIDNLIVDDFSVILSVYKIFKILEENGENLLLEKENNEDLNENLKEDENKSMFLF